MAAETDAGKDTSDEREPTAEEIRSEGSFAIMSAIISTKSSPTALLRRRGSKGCNSRWARILSAVEPPGNGTLPVTAK